jgi:hypothetical protein
LRPGGELGDITDWGGKLCGAVVRIAGLLHLAENALAGGGVGYPVTAETVYRAIAVGEYLTAQAHAAFSEMGADEVSDQAKLILGWIKREHEEGSDKVAGEPPTFKMADLYRALRRRFKTSDDMLPALALLVERSYLQAIAPTEEERRQNGKGSYSVNPEYFAAPTSGHGFVPAVGNEMYEVYATENSNRQPGLLTYSMYTTDRIPEPVHNVHNAHNGNHTPAPMRAPLPPHLADFNDPFAGEDDDEEGTS